jgi:hypothetical protein
MVILSLGKVPAFLDSVHGLQSNERAIFPDRQGPYQSQLLVGGESRCTGAIIALTENHQRLLRVTCPRPALLPAACRVRSWIGIWQVPQFEEEPTPSFARRKTKTEGGRP